jgi:hypothetical protein
MASNRLRRPTFGSNTKTRLAPAALAAIAVRAPMGPAPVTSTFMPALTSS